MKRLGIIYQASARLWGERRGQIILLTCLLLFGVTGSAIAAEVRGGGDIFRLGADEVISDDLYVAAGEVFIDGTVEGDLIAAGGYVEVNGTVTGDVIIAAGGINLNGVVQDDARLAGGGIVLAGSIGDDLFAAGGGNSVPGMPTFPIPVGERTVQQGIQLTSNATVGGDAYVVGGQGNIVGAIEGDLFTGMGTVVLGGQVNGDADLNAQNITVQKSSRVGGVLRYQSSNNVPIPAGVASAVQQVQPPVAEVAPQPNPVWTFLSWLWRTILLVIGLALLAWVWVRVAPNLLFSTTYAIEARPVEVGIYGIVVAALIPLITAALVILAGLFWGWFVALATFAFLFGAIVLLWFFSPLLTGLWVGRKVAERTDRITGTLTTLLVGALLIVLVARLFSVIPFVGVLIAAVIYLFSFALALGGMWVSRRQPNATPVRVEPEGSDQFAVVSSQ